MFQRVRHNPAVTKVIRQLDDHTIGKISAGEVVERPSSVAKELIENALDSGATRIQVTVEGGGLQRIEVSDNGGGIAPDQIMLALSRHATSKLSMFEDLDHLTTLGFRGEALPSIASVSRLVLRTLEPGAAVGSEAIVEFGSRPRVSSSAGSTGTTVSVRELFGNVPARRKFLRRPSTESAAIYRVVEAYALGRPGVAFSLTVDGRKVMTTSGNGRDLDAVIAVHGSDAGNAFSALAEPEGAAKVEGVDLTGWICAPAVNKSTRQGILFFVNSRWIQNRSLTYALEEAFHSLLMVGRHPLAAVRIEVDPDQVDVNVHPTKAEVKFADERAVGRAVARAIHNALVFMPAPPVPSIQFDNGFHPSSIPLPSPQSSTLTQSASFTVGSWAGGASEGTKIVHRELPALRVLGQVAASYIIAEGPEGLYMIDQHAAHERVLYERLLGRIASDQVEQQPMLDPIVVDLSSEGHAIAIRSREELERMGFALEEFGDQSVAIRAVPASMVGSDVSDRFLKILRELEEGGSGASWLDSVAISVACHASIRAGQLLSLTEMRELVQQLEQTEQPRACGHGRPTMLQLSQSELEKQFGRR
ncbi:DNA mismatch repair endonuclease MutL [soil metagenome]